MEQQPASIAANATDEISFASFISFLFCSVIGSKDQAHGNHAPSPFQLPHILPFTAPHS
jgi:hypothetical protein